MPPETAAIAPKGIRKLGKVDLDWARKAPLNAIIGAAFVTNFFNNAAICQLLPSHSEEDGAGGHGS